MPFPRLWKCHRIRTWCLGSSTEPWKAKPPPFQYLRHFHTFFFLILSINGEMRKFSDSPEAPSSRKRSPYLELKRLWNNTEFSHSSPEAPSSRRRGTAMTPDAPMEQFAHTQSVSRCKDPLCTKLRCPLHETRMPFARKPMPFVESPTPLIIFPSTTDPSILPFFT